MTDFKDSPNKYPLPPLLTLGMLGLCALLDRFLPLGWEPEQVTQFMRGTGMMIIVLAVMLDIWTFLTFKKHGANILPNRAASSLIASGPFAHSRNPIYLANVMLVAGFGFALGSRWFLLGGAVLFFLLGELAIKREEKHMAANFPLEWEAYSLRVRRWI